jgi:hypothetical protein
VIDRFLGEIRLCISLFAYRDISCIDYLSLKMTEQTLNYSDINNGHTLELTTTSIKFRFLSPQM